MANLKRKKDSSLPPSLQAHLFDGPQQPQSLSPTGSPGVQEDVELPLSPFEAPRLRRSPSPLRPLIALPAPFPDTRRQYPGYESGAPEPVSAHSSTSLPSPERASGSSSIPHGPPRRYRSPVVSDPAYPAHIRIQGPPYPGSHSLPPVLPRSPWREGEAGPSSLAHGHPGPYGAMSRQISPGYLPPQPIHRRATEPGGYPSVPHVQPTLHGSYERLRLLEQPVGYPPRPPSDVPPYSEASQSRISLPPLYTRAPDGPYGAPINWHSSEQIDLPPLYALQSHSSTSSDYTRVEDDRSPYSLRPELRRKVEDDFETNPRRTKVPKKILVACDFCRGRKLRCDGIKPTCCNCVSRQIECCYVDQPKRRGPGKAAKGSKTKKRVSKGGRQVSETFSEHHDFQFDVQSLAPELRARASFDSGVRSQSTSSQSAGGRYPSQQPSPEGSQGTPQQRRTSRSRKRAPSSEYSPPPDSQSRR